MVKLNNTGKNIESRTYRGVEYRSILEKEVAKKLYVLKRRLKKQFSFKFENTTFPYRLEERLYNPDFEITREDGSKLYIEVKGYLDRHSAKKMLAVRDCNPDVTFVFLFAKNNLIRRGAKMRYSDWCEKHGFDYAFEDVPERWLTDE